ncbi:hypothetical protein Sdagh_71910 [Streptomyces daghestanicus]|uniref:Uncharacterized protein n=1 Tax=Streptomyces daghestanicus TaxID=66885 RepID=A0ABQ3QDV8_9ACTN|nr:hypothetical protein Sdagh_71910 [Streptomyces daghestanicus]
MTSRRGAASSGPRWGEKVMGEAWQRAVTRTKTGCRVWGTMRSGAGPGVGPGLRATRAAGQPAVGRRTRQRKPKAFR